MRANVDVDGFNLYYGLKRHERQGKSYKWLDLAALCRRELPNDTLHRIRYFTALVVPRPHNPQQGVRQQTYLRALQTLPTEMVALARTQLILVVTDETGDDPLAATGLLMVYLPEIAVREQGNRRAQLYRLRPLDLGRQREDLQKTLRELAERHFAHVEQMIARERTKIEAWTDLKR